MILPGFKKKEGHKRRKEREIPKRMERKRQQIKEWKERGNKKRMEKGNKQI
jgi:hypothetical protein